MFVEHKEAGEASPNRECGEGLDSAGKLLLKAAAWIEHHGWIQGKLSWANKVCALGALSNAAEGGPYEPIIEAEERLKALLPEPYRSDKHVGSLCALAAWNDERGRTKDEVVAKMRAAALGS